MSDDKEIEEIEETPDRPTVWMSCRATPGCEGRTAYKGDVFDTGNGRAVRYVCTSCNRPWHVAMGGSVVL